MTRIVPTVGRVVWYWPDSGVDSLMMNVKTSPPQPMKADIVFVHSDTIVNLSVFDHFGNHHTRTSVPLLQDGDPVTNRGYAVWMPYQKDQAAKAEALEQQIAENK